MSRLKILLLFVFISTSAKCIACNDFLNKEVRNDSLGWVKSNIQIYATKKNGELIKTSFSSRNQEIVSEHNFVNQRYLVMSPDGRYIVYSASTNHLTGEILYLYDTITKNDQQIFTLPKNDIVELKFSPNSKKIALLNIKAPHRQEISKEGIFLIDLPMLQKQFIPYPKNAKVPQQKVRSSELAWAADEKNIYIMFGSWGKFPIEYFKLNVINLTLSKIEGKPSTEFFDNPIFIENGVEALTYKTELLQWQRGFQKLLYPEKKLSAFIDDKYILYIKSKNGIISKIAQGSYSQCQGITISIIAWIEAGKYLIYRINNNIYIYGLSEKKTSLLFSSNDIRFGWH